ncbi:MAG: putative solute-binding protein [Myxococcota bacterium]
MKRILATLTALVALLAATASSASAAETRSICVFDPAGRSGDYFSLMSRYATEASQWGVDVQLKPYTDEEIAARDYEAGVCDGVVATGVRLQRFNRFASTIEAVGGLPDYPMMKDMVSTVTAYPAKLSSEGNTVVGFVPIGAVYLFVRDRNVDSVPELAGKRIATMDYDQASIAMVKRVGAIVVGADLGTIGPKFNNGDVDACYVSAPAYKPFELQRGLGSKGGILKAPLAQATLQVMLREAKFPEGFADKSRTWLSGRFDEALALVKKAEAAIPANYWVEIPPETLKEWDAMFQSVRIGLRDSKTYDGSMLSVMRKLRCKKDAARAECAENKE